MTEKEALDLFRGNDLVSIGFRADAIRKRLHPEPVISYGLNLGQSLEEESGQFAKVELSAHSTPEDRLNQLMRVRQQQEETRKFLCFAVVNGSNSEATASEYMKTLAIARLYLDNIAHAQIPVGTLDTKLAQVAIRFGANDLGMIDLECEGKRRAVTEEQVRRLIRDAGFTPKQRDGQFRTYFLY